MVGSSAHAGIEGDVEQPHRGPRDGSGNHAVVESPPWQPRPAVEQHHHQPERSHEQSGDVAQHDGRPQQSDDYRPERGRPVGPTEQGPGPTDHGEGERRVDGVEVAEPEDERGQQPQGCGQGAGHLSEQPAAQREEQGGDPEHFE